MLILSLFPSAQPCRWIDLLLSNMLHGTPWAQLQLTPPTVVTLPAVPPWGALYSLPRAPPSLWVPLKKAVKGGGWFSLQGWPGSLSG